jgi:SAM-dependent methyltransferase
MNGANLISSRALRDRTKRSYNRIATQFTDTWYEHLPEEALQGLVQHLQRGASVLDAGCGPGHHVAFLKEEGLEPVGLDFSAEMLRIARASNPNVSFIERDLVVDPLPRHRFDAVWSAIALNHVPSEENRAALGNLVSALKPGGVIGVNVQVGRPSELLEYGSDTRFFEYPGDEKAVQSMMLSHGLELLVTHVGTTRRNIHGSRRTMTFATVVARKQLP